jgi:hypothetical protein
MITTLYINVYQGRDSGIKIIGGNMLHESEAKAEQGRSPNAHGGMHFAGTFPVQIPSDALLPADGGWRICEPGR